MSFIFTHAVPPTCLRERDVLFLLDASSSFDVNAFAATLSAIAQVSSSLIGGSGSSVSIRLYNDVQDPLVITTCPNIVNYLEKLGHAFLNNRQSHSSDSPTALQMAVNTLNEKTRPGVIITITNAPSNHDPISLIKDVISQARSGITFFAIGLAREVKSRSDKNMNNELKNEITALADNSDSHRLNLEVRNYATIGRDIISLMKRNKVICQDQGE